MINSLRKIIFYQPLPAVLITIVLILDLASEVKLVRIDLARNMVALLAIFTLMPWLKRFHQNFSVHEKDKLFLGAVASGAILNLIYHGNGLSNNLLVIFGMRFLVSWLTAIAFALALCTLRDLIFVHRKNSTSRNFFLLLVAIAIYSLIAPAMPLDNHLRDATTPITSTSGHSSLLSRLISGAMIYLMVINSFRLQWIKVLNKRQKIISLSLRAVVMILVISVLFVTKSDSGQALNALYSYSSVIGNYAWACLVFFFIYLHFSSITVLLYLPTASVYDRKVKEISSLHQLSRIILGVFDIDQLAQIILSRTIEVTGANYGWLLLRRKESSEFELIGHRHVPERLLRYLSMSSENELIHWMLKHREPLAIDRITQHHLTRELDYWKQLSGSLLAIPIIASETVIGLLFAVKQDEYGFLPDDKVILTAFANNASIAIENARLIQQSLEREKYEQEIKIAHQAQMKLLPRTMPRADMLEIDAICIPANEVGGDYYDFFQIDDQDLAVVVGDVSGKGAEAAFYMAEAKGVLESLSSIYPSPKELLVHANKIFYQTFDPKTFFSAIYCVFNLSDKRLTFCRAGHCPLIYCAKNSARAVLIEPDGLGLGLEAGEKFALTLTEQAIQLGSGDVLFLYTDGLVEARNSRHEEFGEQKLCDIVLRHRGKGVASIKAEVLNQIHSFVSGHPQHDDLTMVVIKVR